MKWHMPFKVLLINVLGSNKSSNKSVQGALVMIKLMLLFSFVISACSTSPTKESPHFFQGKASDDCDFMGYLDSSVKEESEDKSFIFAKKEIILHAQKVKANVLKIVNINRMAGAVSISAEAYKCSNLLKLKIADDPKLDFTY